MFQTPRDLIRFALGLLPDMPCAVEVFSEDGGSFELTLAAYEGDLVYGYGDRDRVRNDLVLETRLRNEEGDGHNIRFRILRTYFQSGADLLVHLQVSTIEEHYASRVAPRAPLATPAHIRVLYSREIEPDRELSVRLADASSTGVAFITDRLLHPGDLVELVAELPERTVRLEARVVRTIPAIYGRNRIGCEITDILEADRHSLGLLAVLAEREDSEDDRRPDILEQLERARLRQTLGTRRAPRYPYA